MSRRDFLKSLTNVGVVAAAVGLLGYRLNYANDKHDNELVERDIFVMGTVGNIKLKAASKKQAIAAIDIAVTRLRYLEEKLTKYDSSSDIGQLNDHPNKPKIGRASCRERV